MPHENNTYQFDSQQILDGLLSVFENKTFGVVRVFFKDNEPWLVANDIAKILGYYNAYSMTRHLEKDEYKSVKLPGMDMYHSLVNATASKFGWIL